MGSIVLAEKDSQARLYRGTVGGRYGPVLAASGHLFALAEPEDVNPAWKDWSVGILRPEGGFYPNRISGGSSAKRYSAIKDAARQVDTIYIATDPDREGEGIGMNIVNALRRDIGWQGRVLRVIQNANDEKTLKAAFAEAKPVEHFKSLYQSFVARQQADQIYNLSLTRTATVLFRPNGWKGALSIGRVLTPTFGLVCRRECEIADFKARDYFHPWIEVTGAAGRVRLTHAPAEKDRLFERAEADRIMRLPRPIRDRSGSSSSARRRLLRRCSRCPSYKSRQRAGSNGP
ncbi:MAG: type IA DNA topoisomerase [Sphingomonadales bacterium]|nr:type IA DNA topoisomerase [Sphingomonadales bacterium]